MTSFIHSVVMEGKCADRLKCALTDFPHFEKPAFEIHLHHQRCTEAQVTHVFPRINADWINMLRTQMSQRGREEA